jgi:AbrB family looped-hinge helix DNA binding protein
MQATVKVTRGGQISIPYEIRQTMDIEEGDFVTVDVMAVARKAKDMKELGKGEALIPALA